jgi:4'-phosphopantetheinyl transferase EntD
MSILRKLGHAYRDMFTAMDGMPVWPPRAVGKELRRRTRNVRGGA